MTTEIRDTPDVERVRLLFERLRTVSVSQARQRRRVLTMETIQTAMDFVIQGEYVGADERGEVFTANVIGMVAP